MKNNAQNDILFNAVRAENIDEIGEALRNGADINARNYYGFTPLLIASMHNIEILHFLFDNGADPNKQDDTGWTPLFYAAVGGKEENVKILLQYGADPNAIDIFGNFPDDLLLCDKFNKIIEIIRTYREKIRRENETQRPNPTKN